MVQLHVLKSHVQAYVRKLQSGLIVGVGSYSRDQKAKSAARLAVINQGLGFHRRQANSCKTKAEVRVKLAMARKSKTIRDNFIWIRKDLTGHENAMQQWHSYQKKTAPKYILQEYRAFWNKAIEIYSKRLGGLKKGIIDQLEEGLVPPEAKPRLVFIAGTSKFKVVQPELVKGCRYTLEKDEDAEDGEFHMVHPVSGKRYKVKHGKPDEKEEKNGVSNASRSGALNKSWSSKMMADNPGARWVTITDASSPLHGRHILIMPHSNGTASIVWAPEHSGITHKIIQPRDKNPQNQDDKKRRQEEKKKRDKARAAEMTEEDVDKYRGQKKEAETSKQESREKLHSMIREKAGIETDVTEKERKDIEKKIKKLDKKERNTARLQEFNKINNARRKALNEIIEEAKKVVLGDQEISEDTPDDKKRIAEAIRDNAEEFLEAYYVIKSHEREIRQVNKILKTGNVTKTGSDVLGVSSISKEDIKRIVDEEKALSDEISAHHDLILNTRGGIDRNGKEIFGKPGASGVNSKAMQRSISAGALEALHGITGEMAGTSIIDDKIMQELGAGNVAVLADYYLKNTIGEEYSNRTNVLRKYVEAKGDEIAGDGVAKGDKHLEQARKVKQFGKGEKSLYGSVQQATAAALQYTNRAYQSYGQAEGSLNMVAEMLYQFDNNKDHITIKSTNRPALNSKIKRLGLNKSDVIIKRLGYGDYEMRIRPKAFEKLISEKMVAQFKAVTTEPSPQSIKAFVQNEDGWLPDGLKTHLPPDKNGNMQRLISTQGQQAAARLLENQNKIYMNFEAGTGKSYGYILQKAHLEQQTGKPVKTIIAMPSKLMGNFKEEVEKFSNYNVVIVGNQAQSKRAEMYKSDPNTIVITNKEKFYFDHEHIKSAGFDMVVADEAHKITQREGRGKGSRMSRGLSTISKEAKYYVAGTGTPTPSDLSELYFHLNIMDPEKYSSQKKFMDKYGNLHKGAGYKDKLKEILNAELGDRVFTQKKVPTAAFHEQIHNVDISDGQREKYKAVQQKYLKKQILPITRDQRITQVLNDHKYSDNPKYDKVKELIDNHLATKGDTEKVLIYARNYTTVKEIEKFLRKNYPQYRSTRFTGQNKKGGNLSVDAIAKNKKSYLTNEKVKFAIHTDAGTEGLNLQHTGETDRPYGATTLIAMASGANSYATIDQFFSRGNRKGADKDVHGHIILTDTPHDLTTGQRLADKKNVMGLIQNGSSIDELGVLPQTPAPQQQQPTMKSQIILMQKKIRIRR